MPAPTRIETLLWEYERLRDAGQTVSAGQLCESEPELLGELAERIAALDAGRSSVAPRETVAAPDGPPADVGPPLRVPGYEILRLLGEGGMGVVYLARHLALDRRVALKTLRPGATAAADALARREAAVIAKL